MTTTHLPSAEFLGAFSRAAGPGAVLSFARFMELALYDPAAGYYTRRRRRIGRTAGADFFTATSLGPLFGELVAEACRSLLGPRPAAGHTAVEIGVEPGDRPEGVLAGVAHPFAAALALPLGRPLAIPSPAIVFSNELFDAQPCHRLVFRRGRWREIGVALAADSLREILLPEPTPEVAAMLGTLPAAAPEGYHLDLPLAAGRLAARIAALPWTGLFVAFDYGKSWLELAEDTPAGTVRAYAHHAQGNDLLARPGEQDLTGHVCWDWIGAALTAQGFGKPVLESQEAFLVHHAGPALRRLTEAEAGGLSGRKLAALQLLHPGNMGQKFQVLWALRDTLP